MDDLRLRLFFAPDKNLREVSVDDLRFLHAMAVDPATAHLTRPCRDEGAHQALSQQTLSELKEKYRQGGPFQSGREWIIEVAGRSAGSASLVRDMPKRLTPGEQVAWLGIEIARVDERRRGLGSHALRLVENEVRNMGFIWAEVGVFAFNEISLRFFQKNGYHEIGQQLRTTWWQGQYWSGIHLAKRL